MRRWATSNGGNDGKNTAAKSSGRSLPPNVRPWTFFRTPPHCLKKNGTLASLRDVSVRYALVEQVTHGVRSDSPSTGSNYVVGGRTGSNFRYAELLFLISELTSNTIYSVFIYW
jgi:hypothetical protein